MASEDKYQEPKEDTGRIGDMDRKDFEENKVEDSDENENEEEEDVQIEDKADIKDNEV